MYVPLLRNMMAVVKKAPPKKALCAFLRPVPPTGLFVPFFLCLLISSKLFAASSLINAGSAGGKAAIEWIKVPGGEFLMGSDTGYYDAKPAHKVNVPTFLMAETEVTFGQYKACMAAGACSAPHIKDNKCFVWTGTDWAFGELPDSFQADSQPVVCVDWFQAKQFAGWAGGTLPSEAQWEYAARSGGKTARYPWGGEDADCKKAVMDNGVNGCGLNRTWPVCSMPEGKTRQGICDMIGNAWEWCEDAYFNSYEGAPADGTARQPLARFGRVKRGSSWRNAEPWVMTATDRGRLSPEESDALTGFRPVKELP